MFVMGRWEVTVVDGRGRGHIFWASGNRDDARDLAKEECLEMEGHVLSIRRVGIRPISLLADRALIGVLAG